MLSITPGTAQATFQASSAWLSGIGRALGRRGPERRNPSRTMRTDHCMAARLKVFTWSDGFHAYTVAASSRPKALEAWGSGQDLFASGLAQQITEGPDFDAAMALPGEVIQRGEAINVGKTATSGKSKRKTGPSAAQRRKIEDLKREIEEVDRLHEVALAEIDGQIAALQHHRAETDEAFAKRRAKSQAVLKKAQAY